MVVKNIIRKGRYYDSVLLLRVSQKAQDLEGVNRVAVVMATDSNKEMLKELNLYEKELEAATPNDLVISLDVSDARLDEVVLEIEGDLRRRREKIDEEYHPKSLQTALELMPEANLAVISVPGEHVYLEASEALGRGLDVFIFSSNVPRDREKELKGRGVDKGLLVMGPDCGTALLDGKILGFGNVVDRGPVGIVAASGTGTQEVTALMHQMGVGITHAIGTGGNDLNDEVGGITTIEALRRLENDEDTKLILLISKPPSPRVTDKILKHLRENVSKPVVVNFVGGDLQGAESHGLATAGTLDMAAVKTVNLIKGKGYSKQYYSWDLEKLKENARREWHKLSDEQKYIRGLFSGGTLCSEAQVVLKGLTGYVYSNSPLNPEFKLEDSNKSFRHALIDMGGEEFVSGRPHPMIDPTLRRLRLKREAEDPEVAVILLDVVLGYGAHIDPAGALMPDILEAKKTLGDVGRYVSMVGSVTGTEEDPQNLSEQENKLRKTGVVVLPSNAQAAVVAGLIANRGCARAKLKRMYGED